MSSPLLNLTGAASALFSPAGSKSKPSYDSWRYEAACDEVFATRANSCFHICNAEFPIASKTGYSRLYISGVLGKHCTSRVLDNNELLTVESGNTSATITIRTGSGSGSYNFTNQTTLCLASLSYDPISHRMVFSVGTNVPKAFLWREGIFAINTDVSFSSFPSGCKLFVSGDSAVSPGSEGTALATFSQSSLMLIQLRTDASGTCGIQFCSQSVYGRFSIFCDHNKRTLEIYSSASIYRFGYDKLGSVIVSSVQYPDATMPLASSLFYLYGSNANAVKGPHWKAHTEADAYPLFQQLNYTHDNISMNFDCMYESATWKSCHASGSFKIEKIGGQFTIKAKQGAVGAGLSFNTAVCVHTDGKLTVGSNVYAASGLINMDSTTGTLILPRMSTAERNALTAVNGMILYNTTLGKIQVYESGAWASVI
jgi:hypothetical protein